MKLSMRTDYGTRAVIDLAQRQGDGPVQSAEIAARQAIPEAYLEQLLTALRKAGLVRSTRGPHGGHELARPPADVTLCDVVMALEGPLGVESPQADGVLSEVPSACVIREVWAQVTQAVTQVLQSITVDELVQRQRERERRVMYYI
jgi:Rrf2 family protein